ncbi:CAP domain-containing protein [Bacillus sp. V3B]|nr:CAP domain-containing protein [Bacillus sp. V3B]
MGWFIFGEELEGLKDHTIYENIKLDFNSWKENPEVVSALDTLQTRIDHLLEELNQTLNPSEKDQFQQEPLQVEKPALEKPVSHTFSIHNIELGDSKGDVEELTGEPKRSTHNEYGVNWYTYHEDYQNFFMVAYDENNRVNGLYTNQDLISSKQGIAIGSPKDIVLEQLSEPLTEIQKGFISYQIQNNGEYHLFQFNDSYVTIFYDKHEEDSVTAIQIISEDLEQQKNGFYPEGSEILKEGFEFQLFDLTNAARVEHGLHPLSWDNHVKETARDHSLDMALNQYFGHTNLEGQSPFDRMEEDNITFRTAGENLAAGQLSSIFAHEGLMNSLGHRENILQTKFELLGVGVAFDSESRPYFTENFLTK